mgnify:CR=1 FL=1
MALSDYSSHDWRKFTDDAVVVDDTVDHKALKVNNSRVIFTNPKTLESKPMNGNKELDICYGDKLTYKSYTATGELFDAFDLVKNNNGSNSFVERKNEAL